VALPPSIEDKYELLAKLSEGGMGAVYKVRHRLLDEVRVVKVILPHLGNTAELSDRFLREARAASRLRHPNIVQILDFTVDGQGNGLLVLEHIDGPTLKEVLALSGAPPLGLTVEIARQALDALGALHRGGFVHRDIAPDNLMLTRDVSGLGGAGAPLVKLIDLGIAKAVAADGGELDPSLTQTGIFLGKPRYASPEQFAGEPLDARSDLYSFGIVLYELLTGRYPFQGRTVHELLAAHLRAEPLGFAESDPDGRVPPGLRKTVLRLLAKSPEERFATAEDLAAALAPFAAPWPEEALDEILAQRLPEPARPAVAFSAPAAAQLTRRTVQPDPTAIPDLAPPAAAELISPTASRPAPSPARFVPALILGAVALLSAVLWMSRSGSPPQNRPAAQPSPAPASPPPPPLLQPTPAETPRPPDFFPAQPVDRPEPVYPRQARGTGLAARVTVDLNIDDRGRVIKAAAPFLDAEKQIPWNLYRPFKNAALKAARDLRFQPATREGAPVKDKVRLVIEVRER
jgi:serine/threonine-protein kinase